MVDLSHLPLEFTGELFALTDKPDELTPQDGSYLADVVSDLDLVRIVTSHARGPVWFRWGTKDPGANLYCETPLDDEVFLELAYRAKPGAHVSLRNTRGGSTESPLALRTLRCVSVPCGVGCPGFHESGSPFVEVGSYVGLLDLVADGVDYRHLDDGCWRVGRFEAPGLEGAAEAVDGCLLGEAVVAQHLGECHVGQRVTRLGGGGEHETAAVVEGVGLLEDGDGFVAATASSLSGTRCSARVVLRSPGMRHWRMSLSISHQRAPRVSPLRLRGSP